MITKLLILAIITQPMAAQAAPTCLATTQWRTAIEAKTALPLSQVMKDMKPPLAGEVVSARLCEAGDGLRYLLTLVDGAGKVTRVEVRAMNGQLIQHR